MKIKSLLLLVEPKSESNKEKVLPSGIIIPAGVKEKSNTPIEGVIKQTGGPTSEVPMEVEIGEAVWYMKDAVIVEVNGNHLVHQDSLIQVESERIVDPRVSKYKKLDINMVELGTESIITVLCMSGESGSRGDGLISQTESDEK